MSLSLEVSIDKLPNLIEKSAPKRRLQVFCSLHFQCSTNAAESVLSEDTSGSWLCEIVCYCVRCLKRTTPFLTCNLFSDTGSSLLPQQSNYAWFPELLVSCLCWTTFIPHLVLLNQTGKICVPSTSISVSLRSQYTEKMPRTTYWSAVFFLMYFLLQLICSMQNNSFRGNNIGNVITKYRVCGKFVYLFETSRHKIMRGRPVQIF